TERPKTAYQFIADHRFRPGSKRPIIVGTGPCGLFAALLLAKLRLRPLLLERGKLAGPRARDVTHFWRTGEDFKPDSNVQFGEGGAGTFSDGKLYTQIKDREYRIRWILEQFVAHGAPHDILVNSRPHIGTDRLIKVLRQLREAITEAGGEFRFESRVTELLLEDGRTQGVRLADGTEIEADHVILAVGHSARDGFEMAARQGLAMEAKPFSVGVRIEHPQKAMNRVQYGRYAEHPKLGAAAYKFAYKTRGRRGVYSFCMCPGGLVVG